MLSQLCHLDKVEKKLVGQHSDVHCTCAHTCIYMHANMYMYVYSPHVCIHERKCF